VRETESGDRALLSGSPNDLKEEAALSSNPIPLEASEVLEREFLEIRARLLHVAASLDRLDRASGSIEGDPRVENIHKALSILGSGSGDRAEQIQLLFSRSYEPNWLSRFKAEVAGSQRNGGRPAAK
jgi:hypothetical protein